MKIILLIFFILGTISYSWADLYLQTEYLEGTNTQDKVVTKHHIFLNQKYTINYRKKSYVLTLKKLSDNEAQIETESYDLDKVQHKTFQSGAFRTCKIGKSFSLIDKNAKGQAMFSLKILLERKQVLRSP